MEPRRGPWVSAESSDAGDLSPRVGHQGVAGEGRMDAVTRPVRRRGGLHGFVEHRLERDQRQLEFLGQFTGDGPPFVHLREPLVA